MPWLQIVPLCLNTLLPREEVKQIKKTKGNVSLDKSTVKYEFFCSYYPKPGAISFITSGIKISATIKKEKKDLVSEEKISEKNSSDLCLSKSTF